MHKTQNQFDFDYLKQTISQQDVHNPHPAVQLRVMSAIQASQRENSTLSFRPQAGLWIIMTSAILVLLWGIIKPGIVLQWQQATSDVMNYEIYRAPEGSDNFTLVSQISNQEEFTEYTFIDPIVTPGQTYTYRIEAVSSTGQPAFNQTLTDSALSALPAQIAILVTSIVIGYGFLLALNYVPNNFQKIQI